MLAYSIDYLQVLSMAFCSSALIWLSNQGYTDCQSLVLYFPLSP